MQGNMTGYFDPYIMLKRCPHPIIIQDILKPVTFVASMLIMRSEEEAADLNADLKW